MKYRKKPVVIEAFKFDGTDESVDKISWIIDALKKGEVGRNSQGIHIETLDGIELAAPGDYIIKGVNGQIYPCKADEFELTYEEVIKPEYHYGCCGCKHIDLEITEDPCLMCFNGEGNDESVNNYETT